MAKKKTELEYLEKFKKVHNNKYTYLKFPEIYNQKTKIGIICPKHGLFYQQIGNHANGMGCSKCAKVEMIKTKLLKSNFTENRNEKYKEKILDHYPYYDLSISNLNISYDEKISVKCTKCGNVSKKRLSDLIRGNGAGCTFCRRANMEITWYGKLKEIYSKKFLERGSKIYNNKYDYSKVNYINLLTPIEIVCPIHGSFFKTPNAHLNGFEGCPHCSGMNNFSYPEQTAYENILIYFKKEEIIPQFKIITNDYLKNKPFDFYIPKINLILEIQGPQHDELAFKMTEEDLRKRKEIDINKERIAKELGYNFEAVRFKSSKNNDFVDRVKNAIKKYMEFNDYPNGDEISQ